MAQNLLVCPIDEGSDSINKWGQRFKLFLWNIRNSQENQTSPIPWKSVFPPFSVPTKSPLIRNMHWSLVLTGDHICCLGRWNLIASNSSSKFRRQRIPTNCTNSVPSSLPFIKWVFLNISTIFCFFTGLWATNPRDIIF